LKSNLERVDAHRIKAKEYEELPRLTNDMLARAKVNKGGRPLSLPPCSKLSQQRSHCQPAIEAQFALAATLLRRAREIEACEAWLHAMPSHARARAN
jgi:hypothetical protein